jgi:hypothetical protein
MHFSIILIINGSSLDRPHLQPLQAANFC